MITCAAVKAVVNGSENVFPVHRHRDFYWWMKMLGLEYDAPNSTQGFIDWDGKEERFVDRATALQIARECNQIIHEDEVYAGELFSEALW
jgi:hypothetical protein